MLHWGFSTLRAAPVSTYSPSLPPSLGLLAHLKVLLLEGNPLRGLRRDLLTVGGLSLICCFIYMDLLTPPPPGPCSPCRKEPQNFSNICGVE